MSINLIEIAKDHFSDAVVGKIASSLGLDPNTAQNIIGKVFPALMGSFGDKAQTTEGATQLFDTINNSDAGILDNLTEAFSGDNSELIETGKGLLGSLLGGKLGSLTDVLSHIPGLSTSKAGGLLGLLTPVLAGLLKKQVTSAGLNAAGLTSLLDDQKEHISASLGGDLLGKLGLGSFLGGASQKVAGVATGAADAITGAAGNIGGAVSGAAGEAAGAIGGAASSIGSGAANLAGGTAAAATATTKKASNGLLKLIPVIILALLAFLGIKMCKKGDIGDTVTGTLDKASSTVAETTEGAKNLTEATGGALGDLKDGVADIGNQVAETAGEAASAVVDSAADAANSVGESIADGTGNMVDAAGNATAAVVEGAADAANSVGESIAEGTGNMVDAAGNATSAVVEGASDLGDAVKDTVVNAGANMGEAAEAVTEAAETFVPTPNAVPLSEKAAILAKNLSTVQIPESGDIDALYTELGKANGSEFLYRIPFATGQTGVPNSHQEALIAKLKEADPSATIVTIGYADVRGDDALNKRLSYGRAKEVGSWIKTTLGNDTSIESFSMGETDRFSKTEFSKNRAVEVWQIK